MICKLYFSQAIIKEDCSYLDLIIIRALTGKQRAFLKIMKWFLVSKSFVFL